MAWVRTCLFQHKNANCIKEETIPEAQKQAVQFVSQNLILSTESFLLTYSTVVIATQLHVIMNYSPKLKINDQINS